MKETRWSEWIESMRKDFECTFGILKGRFRILKAGIRCFGVELADKFWMTCCALHNMLLEADGISGEWDGDNGKFDYETNSEALPFPLMRLHNPSGQRNYDTSGMGPGEIDEDEVIEKISVHPNTTFVNDILERDVNDVNLLLADFFRNKLVEHFDILFKKNEIKWTRKKKAKYSPADI